MLVDYWVTVVPILFHRRGRGAEQLVSSPLVSSMQWITGIIRDLLRKTSIFLSHIVTRRFGLGYLPRDLKIPF
jgi:hypothetical protein